jgi:hypothetical protein
VDGTFRAADDAAADNARPANTTDRRRVFSAAAGHGVSPAAAGSRHSLLQNATNISNFRDH